jgi:general secretion pathway protein E
MIPTDQAHLLPFAFARDFLILAQAHGNQEESVDCWISEATPASALAEISRRYGALRFQVVTRHNLQSKVPTQTQAITQHK